MIKLKVATRSDATISHIFDQAKVTIGSEISPSADITIPGIGLQDNHIQIIFENSQYYAVNVANDPFATLNGRPFGRKAVKDTDIIGLCNTLIYIEIEKGADLQNVGLELSVPLMTEEKKKPAGEEFTPIDIEALLNQMEQLAEKEGSKKQVLPLITANLAANLAVLPNMHQTTPVEESNLPSPLPSAPAYPIQKPSLKDYYLSEYDDIGEDRNITEQALKQQNPDLLEPAVEGHWQTYIKICFALLGIIVICSGLAYLWISDQSDKEEINAAKGVADVAMALTYAQLKEIQPQNHNWSDPDFIKNNLIAVLAPSYPSLTNFDNHGHFAYCPYLLRIYTSGDLTQFWVIAQPAPSLLQWLIPKSTIILDSKAMEMRKIKDLKSLNRLLVNANTLDSTSGAEVSNLIRQGGLITLTNLVSKNENLGFATPKALALIRPGAENLIYNAPRYYPLGEELMKKALDLIEKPASSHEVAMLQQEISALSKFPNAVFYSSGGIQSAIQDQRALTTLSPKDKFLVAYLQFNTQGQVSNSHLLMDDAPADIAMADPNKSSRSSNLQSQQLLAMENDPQSGLPAFVGTAEDDGSLTAKVQIDVDEDNPLFLQLSALNVFRQQALRPINDEMITLLNKETQCAQLSFPLRFPQLLSKYLEVCKEQQIKILKKLDAIYNENTHLPAAEFLNFAKVAGLQEYLREYLAGLKQQVRSLEVTQEQIEKKLQKIEKAANWQELEQQIAETVEILNLERIPDEDNIIAYQNATRSRVIQKLNQFLLSSEHPLPSQAFDAENKYKLIHILKMGWVTDPDTYDFYLSEFELRTSVPLSQLDDMDEG